jgi:mannose-6-phosphate isomerase-like protein (cupin superfamily)
VKRHVWGDRESGLVADWIYTSGEKLHVLMFGLAPGGQFTHSPAYRTIFGADELLYVLQGTMILANPATGEVARIEQGEAVSFGPGTWHHAFAHGASPLRVLEFFAPPPSTGTSGVYAATQPYLTTPLTSRDALIGSVPGTTDEASSFRVVKHSDLEWSHDDNILTGLALSTGQLHVAHLELPVGKHALPRRHGGDALIFALDGNLHVRVSPEDGGSVVFELNRHDAAFIPENATYELLSFSTSAELLIGVAPRLLP